MFVKKVMTVCLLLFVGATVGAVAIKGLRRSGESKPAPTIGTDTTSEETVNVPSGMIAYYFHGNFRCPTCRTIESYAHDAIEAGFADELVKGEVQWRVLNYEDAEVQNLVRRYEIVAPTVILSKVKNGEEIRWRNLDKVWQMTGDKAEFARYIQDELKTLQDQSPG